jgi:NADPH:quinone reductase-like Zn-dependent oxidoreductase
MKAVVLTGVTPANRVSFTKIPVPQTRTGWVLVEVKAFGLNHSEQILRLSEIQAEYIQKPIIPGIECVGVVADPSDSDLQKGQKVIAMMGGMGHSFNGSYAEYALSRSCRCAGLRFPARAYPPPHHPHAIPDA